MRQFVNMAMYEPGMFPAEKNSGELVTVPDQALTPEEILVRFARGQGVPRFSEMYDDFDDISKMTLEEVASLRNEVNDRVKELEARYSKMSNAIREEEMRQSVENKMARVKPKPKEKARHIEPNANAEETD